MPINSTLDVVVQQDDLIVLGPPNTIDVSVDIGPQGDRGSLIFTGALNPNTLTSTQFETNYGETPEYRDMFLRTEFGPNYGTFYTYTSVPGGSQWSETLNIIDAVEIFLDSNTDFILSASSGGTGIDNGLNTLTFTGDINFAGNNDVTFNTNGTTNITLPMSGSVAVWQDKLSRFASTTSSELRGVISDETGTGSLVFNTDPNISSSLTTSSTTFNLLPTNANTLNIGTSASTLSLASASGTTTINNNLNVVGSITGSLIGNASTATALQTARIIELSGDVSGSASFNGTSNINISTIIQPDSIVLGTDTTGNYVATATGSGAGISVTGSGEGAALTISNTGVTSLLGTTNEIDVSASTGSITLSLPASINADLSGNATTATTLATSRTIALVGDISGSASFNGGSDININAIIQPNSVALGTDTTGSYIATITGTTNQINVSGSGSESATVTLSLPNDVNIVNNLTVGGNLTISGSATYINTIDLYVQDNIILLNSGVTGSPILNSAIEIERGTSSNVSLLWNESIDRWQFTNDGTSYNTIVTEDELFARNFLTMGA